MKKRALDSNVSLNPMVCITRDMRLEKFLLTKPAKLIHRRQIAVQPRPTNQRAIPIGARGRRRSNIIMVIGLKPNVDGKVMKNGQSTTVVGQIARPPTPARRNLAANYSRVVDQMPSTSYRPRFQSTPIPQGGLLVPNQDETDETTLNLDFDGSFFGMLHYSSSDTE